MALSSTARSATMATSPKRGHASCAKSSYPTVKLAGLRRYAAVARRGIFWVRIRGAWSVSIIVCHVREKTSVKHAHRAITSILKASPVSNAHKPSQNVFPANLQQTVLYVHRDMEFQSKVSVHLADN